ncbi:hypothetical protein [Clostridium sp. D46t1_190503_E9]|uniref:hypothetical protein n=1 Tax=Clostridium sp. D46t1_190503_E9 TaxID=2787137 RepID=UPI00189807BC|nr:hypothetical protein [Clostridium sp. D46t1_190503_E9]
MKRKISISILTIIIFSLLGNLNVFANMLDYSIIYNKDISTTKTSYSSSFSNSIYYNDTEGYTGYYYREGNPNVISGTAPIPKYVEITVIQDTSSFSGSTYYNSGGYSGYIYKSGSYESDITSKSVSGSASRQQGFIRTCISGGSLSENPNYTAEKFKASDTSTWEYWEVGSVWGGETSTGYGNAKSSSNFSVSWSDSSITSASYNDGIYKGSVNYSYNGSSNSTSEVYKSNPSNGYTPPYTGQSSLVRTTTYNYSLSGTVYKTVYKQIYSGYVYTDDTRVWEQAYKGIAQKKIEKTLNASFTHTIPRYLEENKSINVKINAKNTGTLSWKKEDLIKLQNIYSDINIDEKFELDDGVEVKPGQSYSWTISLPPLLEGDYKFSFNMLKDNGDGNFGDGLEHTLTIYSLKPFNGKLEILNYDYKSEENYYVKNNSDVDINVDGYFDSYTNKYPTHNYVKFESEDNEILEQKTDIIGTVLENNLTKNTFTLSGNSKLTKYVTDNKNYVKNTQKYIINGEDTTYKLYNKTEYQEDIFMKYGDYVDSNKFLHIDGTAPKVVDKENDIDIYNDGEYIYTNIYNIIEEGSGIKEIALEYRSGLKTVKQTLVNNNGIYQCSKKITDLNFGELDKIDIKITATDNVGNASILLDEELYLFKIEAFISRAFSPYEPIFKQGEKGVLKVRLYGGIEKVKITFDERFSELDETLNKEITIDDKEEELYIDFYVPLEVEYNTYNVEVIGYKKGKEKVVYPSLEVKGNIFSGVRTRVR